MFVAPSISPRPLLRSPGGTACYRLLRRNMPSLRDSAGKRGNVLFATNIPSLRDSRGGTLFFRPLLRERCGFAALREDKKRVNDV